MGRQPISIEGMWRPNHASLSKAHERHQKVFYAGTAPFTDVESQLRTNLLWGPVGTQRAMDLGRYNETGEGMSWTREHASHRRERFTQE